jgi:hypothetical protein
VTDEKGNVGVLTIIFHASGEWLEFGPLLLHGGNTAQEQGSAVTYARRYALTTALLIAADEDDDGAKASPARTSHTPPAAEDGKAKPVGMHPSSANPAASSKVAGEKTSEGLDAGSASSEPPEASGSSERGQGSDAYGEGASGPCPHLQLDPLKPDGKPYPKGFARCLQCGTVERVAA